MSAIWTINMPEEKRIKQIHFLILRSLSQEYETIKGNMKATKIYVYTIEKKSVLYPGHQRYQKDIYEMTL